MGINSAPNPRPTIAILIFRLMVRARIHLSSGEVSTKNPNAGSRGGEFGVEGLAREGNLPGASTTFRHLPPPSGHLPRGGETSTFKLQVFNPQSQSGVNAKAQSQLSREGGAGRVKSI